MMDICERQELTIANTLEVCAGTITRERAVEGKDERSVIDYIIVCEEMLKFLKEMIIDESRSFVLRHIVKTKNTNKVITSDHNILVGKFSLSFNRLPRTIRKEFFDFKCEESRQSFLEETNLSKHLSMCFTEPGNIEQQTSKFFKLLNRTFHKCFKKIRIKSGNKGSLGNRSIQRKYKLQSELKELISKSTCKLDREIAMAKLLELENDLANETAEINANKVKEYLNTVESIDGNFSQVGF